MNYESDTISVEDAPPLIMRTAPHDYLPIMTSIIEDGAVTVGLEIKAHGGYLQATGAAKRHPKDLPNAEIGLALAQARAFRAAAEELERITNDRVAKIDLDQRNERELLRLQEKLNEAVQRMESEDGWMAHEEDLVLGADPDIQLVDEEDDSWRMWLAKAALAPIEGSLGASKSSVVENLYPYTVGQLADMSDDEMMEFYGIGVTTVMKIRKAIEDFRADQ